MLDSKQVINQLVEASLLKPSLQTLSVGRDPAKLNPDQFHLNQDDRFDKLSKNSSKNQVDKKSRTEAITILQAEKEGLVINPRRPNLKNADPDLDFKVDGPYPFTHVDIKHPVGSEILKKQQSSDNLETMAYNIGKKSVKQKEAFCGLKQGPETSENVLHVVDLAYVPSHEKNIVKEYCLKRAEDAGGSEGILFLNDNDR